MLSFIAGIVIFLLLFIAKRTLVFLLIEKKQVALSTAVIVLSESSIVLLLYITIDKYRLSGERLLFGFLAGLIGMLLIYLWKYFSNDRENVDSGEF